MTDYNKYFFDLLVNGSKYDDEQYNYKQPTLMMSKATNIPSAPVKMECAVRIHNQLKDFLNIADFKGFKLEHAHLTFIQDSKLVKLVNCIMMLHDNMPTIELITNSINMNMSMSHNMTVEWLTEFSGYLKRDYCELEKYKIGSLEYIKIIKKAINDFGELK